MCKNAKAAFASQSVYERIKKTTKKANVEVTCDRQDIQKQHQCQNTSRLLSTDNISSLPWQLVRAIPTLMDYQKRHCLDCYWYLPTYSSLTSLLKRNLFSIIPWSAVTKQCVVGAGAVKVLLVCYSALILCMSCQVNGESVITFKTDYTLSWNMC